MGNRHHQYPVEGISNRIYNADCIEGMKSMPSASIDLIITDPPFAIDFKANRANYNRTQSRVLNGYNEISVIDYPKFTRAWMVQAHRLLKETGSFFVFSGWNNLKDVLFAASEAGFTTVNHIVWKYQFGVSCKRRFVTSHYHCLFLCKNDAKRKFFPNARFDKGEKAANGGSLRYRDMEDVWIIKREYWHGDKKTPTKLPAELIKKILAYTSEENDLVLDPFLGSGQVAVVSKMHHRKYAGFEIVEEYYEFAKERLDTNSYRIAADSETEQSDLLRIGA